MADITAKMVNELRAKTGQGMMECKKMLTEVAGDIEKAIDGFRKKGVKTSITERAANEGRVQVGTSPDKRTGAIAVVNCNTDFTAKSEPVAKILQLAVSKALSNPGANVAEDPQIKSELTSVAQQTGENVQLGRTETLTAGPDGEVGTYLYGITGKIGVLMKIK